MPQLKGAAPVLQKENTALHRSALCPFLVLFSALSLCTCTHADTFRARFKQGAVHAFLLVRSPDGAVIGTADEINEPFGNAWRSRLIIRFKDGSVDDDTTVYTQKSVMHVLSDHHTQKGPTFPDPLDMTIDTAKKLVTWHEQHNGKDELKSESMDLPDDIANGMIPWVLQNYPSKTAEMKVSYVVASPKPRLVKLAFHPDDGSEPFRLGYRSSTATRFRIHVELGGIAGAVAPIVGKTPPDLHAWVAPGRVPTFLKFSTFLYKDGPIVTIELTSPTWSTSRN